MRGLHGIFHPGERLSPVSHQHQKPRITQQSESRPASQTRAEPGQFRLTFAFFRTFFADAKFHEWGGAVLRQDAEFDGKSSRACHPCWASRSCRRLRLEQRSQPASFSHFSCCARCRTAESLLLLDICVSVHTYTYIHIHICSYVDIGLQTV